jgi:hypothetical protein
MDFSYHLSKVECSFDFVNLDPAESLEFLDFNRSTMYIKRRGKEMHLDYPTSEYKNNVNCHRSVGFKGYIRPEKFYRFAATQKTGYLEKLGVMRISDLDRLPPHRVLERVTYRCIRLLKWERLFHKHRENDRHNVDQVRNRIMSLIQYLSINDAARYAKKFIGGRDDIWKPTI